jgi:hypothetical protein
MKRAVGFLFLLVFSGLSMSAQSITLTKPAGGETWIKGQTYAITWTKSGSMPDLVKITLRNAVTLVDAAVIADDVQNSGSYQWMVPAATADGTYKVRVKAKNTTILGDSGAFTVAAPAPAGTITFVVPHSGDTWNNGQVHTIQWNTSGNVANSFTISLLTADGVSVVDKIITSCPCCSAGWAWSQDIAPGSYRLRIQANGSQIYADCPISISANSIKIISPNGSSRWEENKTYTITWTKNGNLPNEVRITVLNSNKQKAWSIASNAANSGSFSWTVPGYLPFGTCFINILVLGTTIDNTSPPFTLVLAKKMVPVQIKK